MCHVCWSIGYVAIQMLTERGDSQEKQQKYTIYYNLVKKVIIIANVLI